MRAGDLEWVRTTREAFRPEENVLIRKREVESARGLPRRHLKGSVFTVALFWPRAFGCSSVVKNGNDTLSTGSSSGLRELLQSGAKPEIKGINFLREFNVREVVWLPERGCKPARSKEPRRMPMTPTWGM